MKPILITTWLASALFAAGLAFAGTESASSADTGQLNKESATLAKGQQKRGGARDGSGDGCKDGTLAKRQQKRGGARDGSGDGCKDGTLAKGQQKRGGARDGSGSGGGDRARRRDGSCQAMA